MKEIGIYIHIPFCKSKCYYCDFCSFEGNENLYKEYTEALISEIRAFKFDADEVCLPKECCKLDINSIEQKEEYIVKTLYIGGGTPSIIDEKYIEFIIKELKNKFCFDDNAEITIEVNPGTANYNKLKLYKEIGINRLSIGLQSTNNRLLKLIGRIHSYEEFKEIYKEARAIGFNNINIDLIIGLPTQTIEDVEKSLDEVINLNPEHVSVYSLILEDDAKLKDMIKTNNLGLPSEDDERLMYWTVKKKLEQSGYKQYEISNFSKKGYESKHNTDCWKQKEYIGFGLAAHSYFNNTRYSNTKVYSNYIKNIKSNNIQNNRNIEEQQDLEIKMNEFVILGLRMIDGFDISIFNKKFGVNFEEKYNEQILKLKKENLIEFDNGCIRLTNKGIDYANIVWSEFL